MGRHHDGVVPDLGQSFGDIGKYLYPTGRGRLLPGGASIVIYALCQLQRRCV